MDQYQQQNIYLIAHLIITCKEHVIDGGLLKEQQQTWIFADSGGPYGQK